MSHFLDTALAATATTAPTFVPTFEQARILKDAIYSTDNLLISALAGAAKTSTLVLIANDPSMSSIPTLCLAFNKRIAEEMKTRLPSNCISLTLNALGHKVWGQTIGRRLKLDTRKNFTILKGLIDTQRKDVQEKLWDNFSELNRTMSHIKSQGWVPSECKRPHTSLMDDEEFFDSLDEELSPIEVAILSKAILLSIEQSYEGLIDFDDQLYMSTLFSSRFPSYPLTMIDEAQDLTPLNHAMLEKIVDGNRLFAVGDPCQAIYGFRGAYGDSMTRLSAKFSMRELILSISFRCPRAVVQEAQWRAPHMTSPEWAVEGEVRSLLSWTIDDLSQDAVIICRNNAPIFRMAIALLSEGRYPQIIGNDIGKTLIKTLDKLGPKTLSQAEAYSALDLWKVKRLSKTRPHARGSIEDLYNCLAIFVSRGETLGGAITYADHIMNVTGPVKMMTGHKAKGLEFHNVYILDRQLLRLEEESTGKSQDRNLLYVMQTRAQRTLTYITGESFIQLEGNTNDA